MGLCSAKVMKTQNNANNSLTPNNKSNKNDYSHEANKSERSI